MKAIITTTLKSAFVFASVMMTLSAAQSRTLFWTGYGSGHTYWQCSQSAINDGYNGAVNSCIQDYGIQYHVCVNAPIERVEDLGPCVKRVYINVP